MTASKGTSTRNPMRFRAAGMVWAALILATGTVFWEYSFNALLHPDVRWNPTGLGVHMLLDVGLIFLVALLALRFGVSAARSRRKKNGGLELGVLVGVTMILFFVIMFPIQLGRDQIHETLGQRFNLALAETQTTAVGSDLTVTETARLCSFRSVRNPLLSGTSTPVSTGFPWLLGLRTALRDALLQQAVLLPLLVSVCLAARRPRWRPHVSRPMVLRFKWATAALCAFAFLFAGFSIEGLKGTPQTKMQPFNACTDGGPVRAYDVSAIHVDMTLNRFGDHDASAYMYALDERIPAIRAQENAPLPDRVSLGLRKDPIQPLVIRANLGECLVINFTNQLNDGPASMHILGLPHTVANAGGAVGNNPVTFADSGQTITYQIPLPLDPDAERAYYFHDHGASRQRINHGLFGALVAEPQGAAYLDPETGAPLDGNNWEAIIMDPNGINFREFVIMYHEIGDETFTEILDAEDKDLPQVDDLADIYRPAARALNYRSEPFRNRLELQPKGKSHGYGSYMFGDPSTPIPRSYLGEATKTRLMHGGSEVFHVHHLHGGGDRWRRNPNTDPNNDFWKGLTKVPQQNVFATHLDSQSIGPGTSYNLEHECGAGGCQQVAGDFLYHCHIGHHYLAGMWAFWRVFDTQQPDLALVPDLFQGNTPPPLDAISAHELLGQQIEGKTLVSTVNDPATERSIEAFIEAQLPPPGIRLDEDDATVWDWIKTFDGPGIRYFGEPETTATWANYQSPTPAQRPEILFNARNGRYTWPLFRPHLGQRPPFSGNGHTGAPWLGNDGSADRPDGLCPTTTVVPGRRKLFYPLSSITLPIQVTAAESDPDGMIFVLNEEKQAVLAGTQPAEPLAIRSSVGDCVELLFTNEIPDGPLNKDFSKVNIHSHFVQFDPQASDGVISGFSYEQSVRPHQIENRFLTQAANPGATTIQVNHANRLRPGIWLGIGLGEGVCADPSGGSQPVPCTEIRRILDINGSAITLDAPLQQTHAANESVGVEFVRYNWYSDVDTGTVFFHTHVEFKDWDHGLFGAHIVEPKGSTYHHPITGVEVRSGTLVDIHAPTLAQGGIPVAHGVDGSFREFVLFLHNNSPVEGPFDEGGGTINLRAEPFDSRAGSPAFRFSSVTHDDPHTQEVRAYLGDPVIFRGMGLVERVGGLRVTGHRFAVERFADTADPSDGTFIGISERFDVSLEGGAGSTGGFPGDYLYYSTTGRDFESGAWGILRVHDTLQGTLQVLPGRPAPPTGSGFPQLGFTGGTPPALGGAGQPCPGGAPLRSYAIEIAETNVVYHDTSEDSGGVVYRLDGASGDATEPLVMRANSGECVEITLANGTGQRASLNLGELPFDPQRSYGAAIGFNYDSTIAPGQSKLYRYYADRELGIVIGLNLAQVETVPRGAYTALVVEPQGAQYFAPGTTDPLNPGTGIEADILDGTETFREFVALFSDEDRRLGQNTMPYPPEADGFSGISYSAEPLEQRDFDTNPQNAFNSALWGDPRLVVEVPAGTPLTFRVAAPWGEQNHVFALEGHRWFLEPQMTGSEQLFSNVLVAGMSFDAMFVGGAGGDIAAPGDYLFLDRRLPFTEAGLWGILRVTGSGGGAGGTDSVTITRAEGKQPGELEVRGINGTLPGGGYAASVTVHAGAASGSDCPGTVLGSTSVDPSDGEWRFEDRNLSSVPSQVCVESAGGGIDQASVGF